WKTVLTEVYDKKGVNVKTFPEYDGIVRKAYDPDNGLLARYASGNYGWYDVNNLPSYSASTGTTTESTSAADETSSAAGTTVGTTSGSNTHLPANANN
ncbi:MAG: hypothetical protein K2G22_05985, partial [Eubacterium sp.]|nr:hypothetical protein [Eubacterium sp.]